MEDWNSIARSLGFENEATMWHTLYEVQERSVNDLSKVFQKGTATIVRRLHLSHIEMRGKGGPNNSQGVMEKLHHISPILLFTEEEETVARLIGVHPSTVYKMKRDLTRR